MVLIWTSVFYQEQEKKQRIRGIEAQKANIQAAKAISRMLQSSLGPKGMDKMLQSPDGDVCISEAFHSCGTSTLDRFLLSKYGK